MAGSRSSETAPSERLRDTKRLDQLMGRVQNPAMQGIFRFARHVAFLALVARALLPAGWMPDAHGLTICSVGVPAAQGEHGKAPAQDAHHDICPFAAVPHLASVPDLPQLALPSFHAFAAATDRAYAASVSARFAPGSPRAPPLNV